MQEILLKLLLVLEEIGERDESIFDTYVRDILRQAVFCSFVKPVLNYDLPRKFGMSNEDDIQIREALLEYIRSAQDIAPKLGILTFHQRLAAFQDSSVRTRSDGRWNDYDEFFGTSDPSIFDEDGNIVDRL